MNTPTPADRLTDAERDAVLARQRLSDTLGQLQTRLDPRAFARETMRDVSDRGSAAAQVSLDTARRNPGAVAGAAAGLVLFLIGRPLVRRFRRPSRPVPPVIPDPTPAVPATPPDPAPEGHDL